MVLRPIHQDERIQGISPIPERLDMHQGYVDAFSDAPSAIQSLQIAPSGQGRPLVYIQHIQHYNEPHQSGSEHTLIGTQFQETKGRKERWLWTNLMHLVFCSELPSSAVHGRLTHVGFVTKNAWLSTKIMSGCTIVTGILAMNRDDI